MTRRRTSLSERVYGALLRLFPPDFQRGYGTDMRDLFRDHLRDARARAGLRGVTALWIRTIPDLFFTGFHEHEDEMLHAIVQDARYAARILRKNPVFALVAILVVALGTGAVSTIFSVANAVVLRPLPGVPDAGDVVSLQRVRRDGGGSRSASYPYAAYLTEHAKTAQVAAWEMIPLTLSTGDGGLLAQSNLVTANYFDVLGVRPLLGRLFTTAEAGIGAPSRVIVIGAGLWQREFHGDSAVIGRDLRVNGQHFTVIGVAPPSFNGMFPIVRTDAWVPMNTQPLVRRGGDLLRSVGSGWLELVARVNPGASRRAVATELSSLTKQFSAANETGPSADIGQFSTVQVARATGLPMDAATPVLAFFGVLLVVSGLVLLIASVNVASMLLARAVARRREIAVRIALGAGRRRLVRQLLTESVLLFSAGGAVGLMLSFYLTRLMTRIELPVDVALAIDPTPDARVLMVTLGVALVTGVVFGLAPALQGSRGDVASTLRGDTSASARSRSRLRNVLVGAQVAASLMLLATSGLFVRALARGHSVDPGYDISHTATALVDVGVAGYDTTRSKAFYTALTERLRAYPGVTQVAYTRVVPLSMNNMGYDVAIPGHSDRDGNSTTNLVAGGYFELFRLPIIEGRALLESDDERQPKVAVVSEGFVKRFFPGASGVGRQFKLDSSTTVTVVGVTRDVKFAKLDEQSGAMLYLPIAQHWRTDVNVLVKTTGDEHTLAGPIRAEMHALDPMLPPPVVVTLERSAGVALLPQRFAVGVTAALGLAGLLLATIGLYGVLSFSTAQRTREIGVRMALGAAASDVVRLVVGEGMRVVGIGMAVGLVLALVGSRALAPFLFGVNPLDAVTYAATATILGGAAMVACLLPARRAAATDPMLAIRQD